LTFVEGLLNPPLHITHLILSNVTYKHFQNGQAKVRKYAGVALVRGIEAHDGGRRVKCSLSLKLQDKALVSIRQLLYLF